MADKTPRGSLLRSEAAYKVDIDKYTLKNPADVVNFHPSIGRK